MTMKVERPRQPLDAGAEAYQKDLAARRKKAEATVKARSSATEDMARKNYRELDLGRELTIEHSLGGID